MDGAAGAGKPLRQLLRLAASCANCIRRPRGPPVTAGPNVWCLPVGAPLAWGCPRALGVCQQRWLLGALLLQCIQITGHTPAPQCSDYPPFARPGEGLSGAPAHALAAWHTTHALALQQARRITCFAPLCAASVPPPRNNARAARSALSLLLHNPQPPCAPSYHTPTHHACVHTCTTPAPANTTPLLTCRHCNELRRTLCARTAPAALPAATPAAALHTTDARRSLGSAAPGSRLHRACPFATGYAHAVRARGRPSCNIARPAAQGVGECRRSAPSCAGQSCAPGERAARRNRDRGTAACGGGASGAGLFALKCWRGLGGPNWCGASR